MVEKVRVFHYAAVIAAVAMISLFITRPAWAPGSQCPGCTIKLQQFEVTNRQVTKTRRISNQFNLKPSAEGVTGNSGSGSRVLSAPHHPVIRRVRR